MAEAPTYLGPAEAADLILKALEAGRRTVQLLRLDAQPRRRVVVRGDGSPASVSGNLGTDALDRAADALAAGILDGETKEGRHTVDGVPIYSELHNPQPELVIVGAGHIAQPLAQVGTLLGFRVVVADDRPDFATRERFPDAHGVVRVDFQDPFAEIPLHGMSHLVLVTRGHKYDYECLRRILLDPVQPRYVGMIGSRRRVRATFQQLLDEGIPRDRLSRVRAPLGLDLGAETPAEIAVAVAGELVQEWRGGSGVPLHQRERILERFFSVDSPAEPEP